MNDGYEMGLEKRPPHESPWCSISLVRAVVCAPLNSFKLLHDGGIRSFRRMQCIFKNHFTEMGKNLKYCAENSAAVNCSIFSRG
jgi:hypothetical protein